MRYEADAAQDLVALDRHFDLEGQRFVQLVALESVFEAIVPWLILGATGLILAKDAIAKRALSRTSGPFVFFVSPR